jgi:glycine hydroxymethyltransferase
MLKSSDMNEIVKRLIQQEELRQQNTINLIPSENFTSKAVRQATGSVFMHKYSEGNIGARYYEGNEVVDELESECIRMVKKVMLNQDVIEDENILNNWDVNVQVLSGSTANLAVYNAVLTPGDTILSMYLPDGGHLSHGWSYTPKSEQSTNQNSISDDELDENKDIYLGGSVKSNFNSKVFNIVQYRVEEESELVNYDRLLEHIRKYKPKMLITGGTAYPRFTDFKKIREIIDEYKSETGERVLFLADVAHEAGLIAGGVHPSPFNYADFVTFTTHKTLRGPRGAVVMCRHEFIDAVNKSVMPGLLGGPFNHSIAGILQCLYEADTEEFKEYSKQVVLNAKRLSELFIQNGYRVVSGGTDKHMILVDFSSRNISGRVVSRALSKVGVIANKNTIPYDKGTPVSPSGVRFGTPFVTTRGFREKEIEEVFEIVDNVVRIVTSMSFKTFKEFEEELNKITISADSEFHSLKGRSEELCARFPLKL